MVQKCIIQPRVYDTTRRDFIRITEKRYNDKMDVVVDMLEEDANTKNLDIYHRRRNTFYHQR